MAQTGRGLCTRMGLTSPAQSYANLDGMTPSRLEEFLKDTELFDTQKDEVRRATRKVDAYQEAIFWHRLHSVKQACADFRITMWRGTEHSFHPSSKTSLRSYQGNYGQL